MATRIRFLFSAGSILLAVVMLSYGGFLIRKNTPHSSIVPVRFDPPTNPSVPIDDHAHQASNVQYISGVGIIEPAGEAITIGSQLPGIVSKVFVTPGDHVEAGAPLLVLDDRTAKANVLVEQNNLKAQQAKLREMLGQIDPQRARVDAALAMKKQNEASLKYTQQEYDRAETLFKTKAISEEEHGQRQMNVEMGAARVAEAEAKYREALASLELLTSSGENDIAPSIGVQQAAIAQAQAALAKEEVTLDMHTIRAPISSTVLQVKVRAGEFVPASVLANPLITLGVTDPYHVRVDIDESDIPRLCDDCTALASVRGRPDVRIPMKLVRREPYVIPKRTLSGSVSERVDTRVLQLIFSVSPSEIQASPGQQVDVYIEPATAKTGKKIL